MIGFGSRNTLLKVLTGAAVALGVIAAGVYLGVYLSHLRFDRRTPYQRDAARRDHQDMGDYAVGI